MFLLFQIVDKKEKQFQNLYCGHFNKMKTLTKHFNLRLKFESGRQVYSLLLNYHTLLLKGVKANSGLLRE